VCCFCESLPFPFLRNRKKKGCIRSTESGTVEAPFITDPSWYNDDGYQQHRCAVRAVVQKTHSVHVWICLWYSKVSVTQTTYYAKKTYITLNSSNVGCNSRPAWNILCCSNSGNTLLMYLKCLYYSGLFDGERISSVPCKLMFCGVISRFFKAVPLNASSYFQCE
jgi:hypothetical protein